MKYLRFIIIFAIACLAFIAIDNAYAASTVYPLNQSNAVNEIWWANDHAEASEPFGTNLFKYSNFWWSWVHTPKSYSIDGASFTSKVIVTLSGASINKYDSFSLTQAVRIGYFTNSLFWLEINGSVSGFIPCEIMSTNNVDNNVSDHASSFVCKYDKNQIKDTDTLKVGFTSFLDFKGVADGVTTPSENPVVFTMNQITFFTDGDNSVVDSINKQTDAINKQTESIDKVDDTLNSTDTSGANSSASGFFDNFEDTDFGLSDIVTAPLNTIKKITSSTCTPLTFPLPFVDKNMSLPCMNTIYTQFGPLLQIYQTITFGMIAYWVCINIFASVRQFKDPDRDEIEVVAL